MEQPKCKGNTLRLDYKGHSRSALAEIWRTLNPSVSLFSWTFSCSEQIYRVCHATFNLSCHFRNVLGNCMLWLHPYRQAEATASVYALVLENNRIRQPTDLISYKVYNHMQSCRSYPCTNYLWYIKHIVRLLELCMLTRRQ